MPSTYSTSLRLELIGNGEQAGNWGYTTNTNLGTLLEQAITGVINVPMVGSTTLTVGNGVSDQSRNAVLVLTGTLASAADLIVPTVNKLYTVRNATSNGQTVTVKTSAGTGVAITNGYTQLVYCDGTNVVAANQPFNSAIPSGTVSSVTLSRGTTGLLVNNLTSDTITNTGTFTLGGVLNVANGGTGTSTLPTAGKLLVGNNASGYDVGSLAGGTAISTSYSGGIITLNNTGVTSLTSGSPNIVLSGTSSGGGFTGNITITDTGGGTAGVTTFSAGGTGFNPVPATSGPVTLSGILNTASGGTGLTNFAAGNNALYSTSSSTLTAGTLPTAAGGTGLTTFIAANNAIYSNSSSSLIAGTLPVLAGGTGATTAAGAISNLGGASLTGNNSFSGTNTFTTTTTAPTFALASNSARFYTSGTNTIIDFNANSTVYYNGSNLWEFSINGAKAFSIKPAEVNAYAFNPYSDRALKKDITPVSGGLGRVLSYKPVTYRWIDQRISGDSLNEGFIAQDIESVNPIAVTYSEGVACFNPVPIIADLVAAIQELSAQVKALKAQVEGA